MAFDFLGTISSFEEFEELEEFIQKEAVNIDKRIDNLNSERLRQLELADKFMSADLIMRADYKKSIRPDRLWLNSPRPKQVDRKKTLDAANAVDVALIKKTFLDSIKYKRERNEFKVKRLLDLAYQIQEEINLLSKMKEEYQNYLERIKSRFDIDDFDSNQRNKAQDSAEIVPGLTKTPVDKGIVEESGVKYYLVLSINTEFNTISFDGNSPPIREGDKITLSGGSNDGVKTVIGIKDSRTVIILEKLNPESNSKTKVRIA